MLNGNTEPHDEGKFDLGFSRRTLVEWTCAPMTHFNTTCYECLPKLRGVKGVVISPEKVRLLIKS
ncbi:hypothetical protein BPAE_0021g00110 [Botrytis paeoniae]|uniref:Uncharacterized protein n=1 Tax=Botrytis paeoniae TaxID=278948 RepID=A0A4Z1FZ13_9HELO|nr:hypothetical protein BPAE_0021g00110 [Botrytis paeoniae]